jgi:hypothetical protein
MTPQIQYHAITGIPAVPFTPSVKHIIEGKTPKHTISQRESIWMPNAFSSSVLSVFFLAIRPSKASHSPETAKQNNAFVFLPCNPSIIPTMEINKPKYVSHTV